MLHRPRLSTLAVIAALVLLSTPVGATGATITYLPDLGGYAFAYAVNNQNAVVGTVLNEANNLSSAALWRDSALTVLGTLGGSTATAYDINDHGQVVGTSLLPGDTRSTAFLWENGQMTDLGCLPRSVSCEALAINNAGEIVGVNISADQSEQAVKWSGGRIINLTPTRRATGRAFAINDAGVVGGYVQRADGTPLATIWDGKRAESFDAFGWAVVREINNAGSFLIEQYTTDEVRSSAYYLVRGEQTIDVTDQNGSYFVAEALNNRDQLSGRLLDFVDGTVVQRIVVWDQGQLREAEPLPDPYRSGYTSDLNDTGYQVGAVSTESGAKAVLWAPTTP
ncbi:hypothetical protein SD80_011675 [Scytonema tolypothrichoides VB-61278]|nr:hypothetical protein SD80_011675 [Scytonema tolypothrichoides VB-61278]